MIKERIEINFYTISNYVLHVQQYKDEGYELIRSLADSEKCFVIEDIQSRKPLVVNMKNITHVDSKIML